MGDADVLLHASHGVMVAGKTVAEAIDSLYYLERAAELVVKAMMTRRPLEIIPKDVQAQYRLQKFGPVEDAREGFSRDEGADDLAYAHIHWASLKRRLSRGWDAEVPIELDL